MIEAKNRFPGAHRPALGWASPFLALCLALSAHGEGLLTLKPGAADFVLSAEKGVATIYVETTTDNAIARAAGDLASDVERVTNRKPAVARDASTLVGDVVLVGVLGHSPVLDDLVAKGKLDAAGLKGSWESYVVQVVESPLPNVRRALAIAGSDRRGAIYGLYEISEAIGVSPWYWWADVTPARQTQLVIAAGTRRFGPPSVQYRGIFINDEDWGLQRWAARTFEPENGNIGPKTYCKVFELLLRLKANTLWPAMHPPTTPFNSFPENKQLAEDYAIVMGSSHAEPMLRNNVGEWTAPPGDYNYITNREGVLAYWEERVRANGRCEHIYTVGMRGIHDSNMQGPKTDAERIRTLEQIFADQRALLATHVRPDVTGVPQIFCAYKEVLELYRQGLRVPDDVTIVWPDDNFGYVRNFATPAEQKRSGGFGVYYHISYLGRPLAYLWLNTTPPALIWEEMSKAYDHGARRVWIVNVGDIKPAEIGTEFFLQMAWDSQRWRRDNLSEFLVAWATREFGSAHAQEIAAVMAEYYQLNFQRKPEHLQWWLPGEMPRASGLKPDEVRERLSAFARLTAAVDRLQTELPVEKCDAFFELVAYPVRGSALANERAFAMEEYARNFNHHNSVARTWATRARKADAQLVAETSDFNERIAGGKWRHIMALEPADNQWSSMRIAPPVLSAESMLPPTETPLLPISDREAKADASMTTIAAGQFGGKVDRSGAAWAVIPGLGRTANAVSVFPTSAPSVEEKSLTSEAPRLDYPFKFAAAGRFPLRFHVLPTYPLVAGRGLRLAYALDEGRPNVVVLAMDDGGPEWARGVLNAERVVTTNLDVPSPGPHVLHVFGVDAGVVLDKIVIETGGSEVP